ncbi:type I polyketide synthase, partial [Nocardia sp. NPDC048505]|uniref:type I polyketide synthase n=1 Tax=Nocardia sp. NPDC048505 TaxID=3155756 RepID=UPI0033C90A4B
AAAGIAGIIKMIQAMRHGVMPKTLHVDEPTPHVDWTAGNVELLTEAREWPERGRPRRAGVSSFGISGTNAHVILEQAQSFVPEHLRDSDAGPRQVVGKALLPWVLSGKTTAALAAQADRLRRFVAADNVPVADVATALARRSVFEHRAVVLGSGVEQLAAGLTALAAGDRAPGVVSGRARVSDPRTVLVFPGQGSQWNGMGRELLASAPVFAQHMQAVDDEMSGLVDWSLRDVVSGSAADVDLDRVDVVQPVLFAVMTSLARLWESLGVRPQMVIGHSQGEIAAAYVAGALSLADAVRVVVFRSRAIAGIAGAGAMVSMAASDDRARELIAPWDVQLSVAAINGPAATVVSGAAGACSELVAWCERQDVWARLIPVDYASHSVQMDGLREQIIESLTGISPRSVPTGGPVFVSAVTGAAIDTADLDATYWFTNLRETVRFEAALRSAREAGCGVFVEASPHPVLIAAIQDTLDELSRQEAENGGTPGFSDPLAGNSAVVVESLRRDDGGLARFYGSAAELFVRGGPVDWTAITPQTRTTPLPPYPFQHQRFWLNPQP